jgi:two-component sensor histidine kinase
MLGLGGWPDRPRILARDTFALDYPSLFKRVRLSGKFVRADARAYMLATLCVVFAFGAELSLGKFIGDFAGLGSFYPAVLFSALLGFGPGIFAAVLSLSLAWFILLPPSLSFSLEHAEEALQLILFTISAALIIAIAGVYRKAQASRNTANELFKTVQDISTEGVVLYRAVRDEVGGVIDFEYRYANPAALGFMTRSDPKRVIGGRPLERLPLARDHPQLFPRYLKVLETGETSEAEYELGGRWFHSNVAKLQDGLVVTVRDVSAKHRSDEAQRLLAQELHHRVKNMLAAVISMTNSTARGATSSAELKEKLLGRFQAMDRAHGLLVAGSWSDALVGEVVRGTLDPHLQSNAHRFVIIGPELAIEPEIALALNMALHELATNAVKYGALSTQQGQVSITWALDPDQPSLLRLCWREKGGPPVDRPSSKGFGTRLLERAFASLEDGDVSLDFAKEGVTCEILFRVKPSQPEVPNAAIEVPSALSLAFSSESRPNSV